MSATPPVAWQAHTDVLVVGGGVAGLSAARSAASAGAAVLVLAKDPDTGTATALAQGGIAAVHPDWSVPGDTVAAHVADTLTAAAGHADPAATTQILTAGGPAVAGLRADGAVFDTDAAGRVLLAREGGHGAARILRAGGDATGAEIQRALAAAAHADPSPPLRRWGATVLRVLTGPGGVAGALVAADDGIGVVYAPTVVLATGGFGQVFAVTTNPAGATGEGLALALDAGAELADMEFVQFHPTALAVPGPHGRQTLISEAVRGEGARLVDAAGRSVTAGAHPSGDLAPRDVVSRAVAAAMAAGGGPDPAPVYLDARMIDDFPGRFPTITAACRAVGIDPARDPIPVAPAAHYGCGGVVTDTAGRTAVPGLLAVGELARTGLHGANRLASNSLFEALVVGRRAGAVAAARRTGRAEPFGAEPLIGPGAPAAAVRELMSARAGVIRSGDNLDAAAKTLAASAEPVAATGRAEIETIGRTVAAAAVLAAASARTESRGCHHRTDRPATDPAWAGRTVTIGRGPGGWPQAHAAPIHRAGAAAG